MNDTAGIGTFLAAVAGLSIIFLVVFVVLWVLKSIGLAQMAKNKGIENGWLAWLPVADLYLMGTIVEEMNLFSMKVTNLGLWFPVVNMLGIMLSGIPILGIIFYLGLIVFQIVFIYHFFKMYTPQATLYTVLCVFFAFLCPIFIFVLRDNPIIYQTEEDQAGATSVTTDSVVNEDTDAGISADNSNELPNNNMNEEEISTITGEKTEPPGLDEQKD